MPDYNLAIYRDAMSPKLLAVMLDDEGGGRRLTPSKGCGSWDPVKRWALSASDLRKLAETFDAAASRAEQTEEEATNA